MQKHVRFPPIVQHESKAAAVLVLQPWQKPPWRPRLPSMDKSKLARSTQGGSRSHGLRTSVDYKRGADGCLLARVRVSPGARFNAAASDDEDEDDDAHEAPPNRRLSAAAAYIPPPSWSYAAIADAVAASWHEAAAATQAARTIAGEVDEISEGARFVADEAHRCACEARMQAVSVVDECVAPFDEYEEEGVGVAEEEEPAEESEEQEEMSALSVIREETAAEVVPSWAIAAPDTREPSPVPFGSKLPAASQVTRMPPPAGGGGGSRGVTPAFNAGRGERGVTPSGARRDFTLQRQNSYEERVRQTSRPQSGWNRIKEGLGAVDAWNRPLPAQ